MKIATFLIICIGLLSSMTEEPSSSVSLKVVKDYYKGLQLSKKENKPIFLCFTTRTCDNPKIVNELLTNETEIVSYLNDLFIPVILYVDDETKLPHARKVVRDGNEITISTQGNEWSHLEITKYQHNVQPLILIIDYEGEILKDPQVGILTKEEMLEYLKL